MNEQDDLQQVHRIADVFQRLKEQLGNVIVGQEAVLEDLLTALFAQGHCLLTGVPGLAKTLMIRTLAQTLSLRFSRIQFTPDLMPADITGTEVIQEDKASGVRELRFLPGPVFANVILADEINRTPPKTQAALLEAMQEYQVTAGGARHVLPRPFFVLATQNPIEQEGTYPLPEAQLDRFMFNIFIDYPDEGEELEIVKRTTADLEAHVSAVLDGEEIILLQRTVRRIPAADVVLRYALQIARRTRPNAEGALEFISRFVAWGAGPRASQYLVLAAKARAALHGRHHVACEDIRRVARPVLRHRIITNFNAEAEGVDTDALIRQIIDSVQLPEDELAHAQKLPDIFGSSGSGEN